MAGARLGVGKNMTGEIECDVPMELVMDFGVANVDAYAKMMPGQVPPILSQAVHKCITQNQKKG
jgi:hypothetical protein